MKGTYGIVSVKVAKGYETSKVFKSISKMRETMSAYEATGQHDIVAIISAPDVLSLNSGIDSIRKIEGVEDSVTSVVLRMYVAKGGSGK